MKIIYDAIHKYMTFDELQMQVIDCPEFQKMRNIKQLGLCYYVFPGASHNRFEHSLGVSYLCGLLIETLRDKQPELKITDRLVQLIKIAGLVHDLGHACFSHFFDQHFLKNLDIDEKLKEHEYRSCILFEHIVKKYNIEINDEEIDIVKKMIDPDESCNSFEFQIVANKMNGLDCDRFDYIARDTYNLGLTYSFDFTRLIREAKVIDSHICYPIKCNFEIGDLYYTRYKLHKQILTHSVIRALEFMILDLLILIDKKLGLSKYITNIDNFAFLTDDIINYVNFIDCKESKELLNRIYTRQLYKLVIEMPKDKFNHNIFIEKYESNNNIIFEEIKLDYSMGGNNPLDFVKFYQNNQIVKNSLKTFIFPEKFQDKQVRIYVKNDIDEWEKIQIKSDLQKK